MSRDKIIENYTLHFLIFYIFSRIFYIIFYICLHFQMLHKSIKIHRPRWMKFTSYHAYLVNVYHKFIATSRNVKGIDFFRITRYNHYEIRRKVGRILTKSRKFVVTETNRQISHRESFIAPNDRVWTFSQIRVRRMQ